MFIICKYSCLNLQNHYISDSKVNVTVELAKNMS